MTEDIRWIQRLNSFKKALGQLEAGIELSKKRELTDLEKQGIIKAFEFTYELGWNLLKDFLEEQGETEIYGSKIAIKLAFQRNLIEDGHVWMKMIESRNMTSHTYNQSVAEEILEKIIKEYLPAFEELKDKMEALAKERLK